MKIPCKNNRNEKSVEDMGAVMPISSQGDIGVGWQRCHRRTHAEFWADLLHLFSNSGSLKKIVDIHSIATYYSFHSFSSIWSVMKSTAKPTKISVQVWSDLIPKLDTKVKDACLRRDAYLAAVIVREVKQLDIDLFEPNSEEAYAFISKSLGRLSRKQVGFTLDAAVVEDLNRICQEKRVVRDAFFNRLIFWLVASRPVVNRILGDDWLEWFDDPPGSLDCSLDTIRFPFDGTVIDFLVDPLRSTHEFFERRRQAAAGGKRLASGDAPDRSPNDSFYTRMLNNKILKGVDLTGLNTYLHDSDVPGTQVQREIDGDWELLPPTTGRT